MSVRDYFSIARPSACKATEKSRKLEAHSTHSIDSSLFRAPPRTPFHKFLGISMSESLWELCEQHYAERKPEKGGGGAESFRLSLVARETPSFCLYIPGTAAVFRAWPFSRGCRAWKANQK